MRKRRLIREGVRLLILVALMLALAHMGGSIRRGDTVAACLWA